MDAETWMLDDISLDRPNVARMYDYLLGGFHNFEIDRVAVEKMLEVYPEMRLGARANRAFLHRVVNFLAAQGIDQFLDIGSGIPTVGNVHEVAQAANPTARVVYVDIDPVAVAHSRSLLQDNANAIAVRGDVGRPDRILNHAEIQNLLDFGRPVAILLLQVLHFILDDERACGVVRTLCDALVPGSAIAIAHGTWDDCPRDILEQLTKLYAHSGVPTRYRSYIQVQQFFEGFELVEPGVVRPPLWRPEGPDDLFLDRPERLFGWVGVGRRP